MLQIKIISTIVNAIFVDCANYYTLRKKMVIPTIIIYNHSIPTVQHRYPVVALASLTELYRGYTGALTSGYVSMVSTVVIHGQ